MKNLNPICHCGNRLTDKEFEFNELYRRPKKLPYQCYQCSMKEIEEKRKKYS